MSLSLEDANRLETSLNNGKLIANKLNGVSNNNDMNERMDSDQDDLNHQNASSN